jgi:uncharacterized protein (DUF2235 family)
MSKNIIICSDGTGNTSIKDRGTNVFKLFEGVDLNGHRTDPKLTTQIALYDDGVGTESFLPLKLLGGAFGWGLKRNVLKLYTGLVRIYDPGDQIYLFGFSRGAFTVRTLAGMVAKCGVLDWRLMSTTDAMRSAVADAYRTYRKGYRTWLWRTLHTQSLEDVDKGAHEAMSGFKTDHRAQDAEIHFIGVWDTVDAVGGPFHISDVINTLFHHFKFPDHKLNDKIRCAAHAISIDDARAAFEPLLWEASSNLEQVWFAGVHSNVGGGYPKQGMSLVALDWMLQKAVTNGLRVSADERLRFWQHSSVDDKLYDSRSGLGVFYEWKPRDMRKLCEQQKVGSLPKIHVSVLERIAHGTDGYAPGTIAPTVDVVYTSSGDPEQDRIAEVRTKAVHAALETAFAKRGAALDSVRRTVIVGRIAYYVYAASCVLVILVALGRWASLENARRLLTSPVLIGILIGGFALSAALAYYVGHTRSLAFSRFWHGSREELREALKAAKERIRAASAGR